MVRLRRSSSLLNEAQAIMARTQRTGIVACAMTCLFNSLEKMSESKRRIFFYVSFIVGGTLTIGGFAGFATQHRGYAFIVVVSGIFILITTGILWDTMMPQYGQNARCVSEAPTAPREDDDPPPDYDSVVRGDSTKNSSVSRSNSKWSLYNQNWCPSFNPKSGYGKTATSETSCTDVVVSERPPSYKQSQKQLSSASTTTATSAETDPRTDSTSPLYSQRGGGSEGPGPVPTGRIQITRETKLEIIQK